MSDHLTHLERCALLAGLIVKHQVDEQQLAVIYPDIGTGWREAPGVYASDLYNDVTGSWMVAPDGRSVQVPFVVRRQLFNGLLGVQNDLNEMAIR